MTTLTETEREHMRRLKRMWSTAAREEVES